MYYYLWQLYHLQQDESQALQQQQDLADQLQELNTRNEAFETQLQERRQAHSGLVRERMRLEKEQKKLQKKQEKKVGAGFTHLSCSTMLLTCLGAPCSNMSGICCCAAVGCIGRGWRHLQTVYACWGVAFLPVALYIHGYAVLPGLPHRHPCFSACSPPLFYC